MLNLNNIYIPKYNENHYTKHPLNYRAKLDTGYKCNFSCNFCYYLKNINDNDKSIIDIKTEINRLHLCGIKEFDLSGGESSLHPDWFEILDYCSIKSERVSTLSNGSKFKNFDFLKKSYEHGLREILFSLHGWDELSHDKKVNHNGAFTGILKAIENANILNIESRINCTVTDDFDPIIYYQLIKNLKITQINLLPMNYWNCASDKNKINYKKISELIKQFIDLIKNLPIEINVRYIPFCYMINYEKYIVGTYQHIFDIKDWNIEVYESNNNIVTSKLKSFEKAQYNRINTYIKPIQCKNCKFVLICDGIEKELLENNELINIPGEIIQNVMHYRN